MYGICSAMNSAMILRYTIVGLLVVISLTTVSSQNFNDGTFGADGDVDYQDFQLPSQRPIQNIGGAGVPQRSAARPRSPAIASASSGSQSTKVTPIPILKQINRHNEDGSYTYGFEGADGSFKIETKSAAGEVFGKYGYVDDSGKVRTVEYGANKYGFQPAGEGITIPPVTFGNDTESDPSTASEDEGPSRQPFVPVPVRAPPSAKPASPKRKPPKQSQLQQPILLDQRFPRPQPQPQPQLQQFVQQPYFVREPEDVQIRPQQPPQQRPSSGPSDFNSLQLILGNELRDTGAPQFQFRSNEIPPQRNFLPDETQQPQEEEPIQQPIAPRPFPQSLTIPSVFDQQPQFAQPPSAPVSAPIDFDQQFDINGPPAPRIPPPAGAFRATARSQQAPRSRPRPTAAAPPQVFFVAQPEDTQQPNAVRRNSNIVAANGPQSRSILDDLLKQYAISNASPAINDFSFSQNAQ